MKKRAQLPETFEELGMAKEAADIFRAAGLTTADMLEQVRRQSVNGRNMEISGKMFACTTWSPYNGKDVYELCTKINACSIGFRADIVEPIVNTPHSGEWGETVIAASALRINFLEVAMPLYTDYLREDLSTLRHNLESVWKKALLYSWKRTGKNQEQFYVIVRDLCIEHYEELEKVQIDSSILEEYLAKKLDEGWPELKMGKDYKARIRYCKRHHPDNYIEWRKPGRLADALEIITDTEEMLKAFRESIIIGE